MFHLMHYPLFEYQIKLGNAWSKPAGLLWQRIDPWNDSWRRKLRGCWKRLEFPLCSGKPMEPSPRRKPGSSVFVLKIEYFQKKPWIPAFAGMTKSAFFQGPFPTGGHFFSTLLDIPLRIWNLSVTHMEAVSWIGQVQPFLSAISVPTNLLLVSLLLHSPKIFDTPIIS